MMSEVALHRKTTPMRSKRLIIVLIVLAAGVSAVAVPAAADNPGINETGAVEFENTPLTVEPPEAAEIEVSAPEGEPVEFEIESAGDERFAIETTVDEHNGSVTIVLDTENVTADDPSAYLSASGGELRDVTVQTNEIDELQRKLLPGGMYDLRIAGETSIHHSTLEVVPALRFAEAPALNYSEIENDPEQNFTGRTDLEPGSELVIRAVSRGEEAFLIANETAVDENGTFEATLDLSNVPPGSRFEMTAHHDGVAKGMTMGLVRDDSEVSESTGIALVYEGERLELEAAPDQRVTGEADLDVGETVTIRLQSAGETAFLHSKETEVDDHGTFEVTFDLDDVPPGTEFTAEARSPRSNLDVSSSAPGIVVDSDDEGDDSDDERQETKIDDGNDGSLLGELLGGFGAIVAGAAIAIVGIGILLGFGRSWSPRE